MSAPDATELEQLAALAHKIAEEAGDLLLETVAKLGRARLRAKAEAKSSLTDLATEADRQSEQLVRSAVGRARPDDAVLGEELGATAGRSGLTWVVDPLDGTTNFVYGFPAWCVSIAVVDDTGPLVGVVRDPERAETFSARRGAGASRDGEPIRLATPPPLPESLIGTGFGYDPELRARQARLLATVLPNVRDIRRAGSAALDLCSVACGRLDGYYEAGLNPWDSAAGALVAAEAGASQVILDDLLGTGPTLVVASAPLLDELVALLRRSAASAAAR